MTYEEAIKILVGHTQYYVPFDDLPAFETAIEVLEKQIPKKPKEIITSDNEYICSLCPICNSDLHEEKYCAKCGQAISWRDEDGR